MITRALALMTLYLGLALTACQVGPEFQRPGLEGLAEKQAWSQSQEQRLASAQSVERQWWTNFQDGYLNGLLEEATTRNLDLHILMGRIREAGANLQRSEAELMPQLNLASEAGVTRSVPDASVSRQPVETRSFSSQMVLSWELDLWGKKRRQALASEAGYKAKQAEYRAGYLKLVSEVCLAYFEIRQLDEQLGLTEAFLAQSQRIRDIYQSQARAGLVPATHVLRQEAEVNSLTENLLELRRRRQVLVNRLSTLIGRPAGRFQVLPGSLRQGLHLVEVPAGLPSQIMARRPDIIAAEYYVLESTHSVAVAEAAKLPSITLTGRGGLVSASIGALLGSWSLGLLPALSMPLFDAGLSEAQVKQRQAQLEVAADQYRKTVLEAFEEVENALANLAARRRALVVIQRKADGLEQIRAQTEARLQHGLISQLEVLDLERELFAARVAQLDNYRLLLDDTVTLYKALGGGWPPETVR